MFYAHELSFLQALLKNFHIDSSVISPECLDISHLDKGLRNILSLDKEYEKMKSLLSHILQPNTICKVHDSFFCRYFFLLLPNSTNGNFLSIGPYTTAEITKHSLMQLAEKYTIPPHFFSVLERYYLSVPFLQNESLLMVAINTLGQTLWGSPEDYTHETYTFENSTPLPPDIVIAHADSLNLSLHMQELEKRYSIENQLLHAISKGLSHKAEHLISALPGNSLEQRSPDPVRNMQNYSIVMNTLLRKAVEKGMVHPLYIDSLSADFAHKIEQISTINEARKLQRTMIHKYSLLVKNHSMKGYSILVQKAIIQIDSDLTADLTLKTLAASLCVNASYLSHLFKKETGITLTDYVNKKRVEYGMLLLNSTALQIQTIAQYCGIPDVNYFTKLFKKYYGKTPSAYRESILR